MQREPFESWAPREVQRLRQEASALMERALTLDVALRDYLASTAGAQAETGPDQTEPPAEDAETDDSEQRGPGPNRAPKYQAVFDAMEEAGVVGMTREDMAQAAEKKGHTMDRNALRPFIWGHVKAGRFVALPNGRYILKRFAELGEAAA